MCVDVLPAICGEWWGLDDKSLPASCESPAAHLIRSDLAITRRSDPLSLCAPLKAVRVNRPAERSWSEVSHPGLCQDLDFLTKHPNKCVFFKKNIFQFDFMMCSKLLCAVLLVVCALKFSSTQCECLHHFCSICKSPNLYSVSHFGSFKAGHPHVSKMGTFCFWWKVFLESVKLVFFLLYSLVFILVIIINQRKTLCQHLSPFQQIIFEVMLPCPQKDNCQCKYYILFLLLYNIPFFILPAASCRGRCGAEYYRGYTCQCDSSCLSYDECCRDYESQCTTSE